MSFHQKKSPRSARGDRSGHAGKGDTLRLPTAARQISDAEDHLSVLSNWNDQIRVGEAELIVLEFYLADTIDQFIGRKRERGKSSSRARGPP